ncbi:MAG TPA: hypothetical protein VFB60_21675 [Ktedonobacteraceae bacterium]|nr:hypothetical protein [Ktedonobacteraceae bacterium]
MAKRRIGGNVMKTTLPCLPLTLEQLAILREVLGPFKQMILRQEIPLPNADLALEAIAQLQTKIQHLVTPATWGEAMAFDANETLILRAAVCMFALYLETTEQSAEGDALKQQCQTLSSLLAVSQAPT